MSTSRSIGTATGDVPLTYYGYRNFVDDFGADPTGGTQCDDELLAALESDTDVFVPAGTYRLTQRAVPSTCPPKTIFGMGINSRFEMHSTAESYPVINDSNDIQLRHLTFQGMLPLYGKQPQGNGTQQRGWLFQRCRGIKVTDCIFYGFQLDPLALWGIDNCTIERNQIWWCESETINEGGGSGIYIDQASELGSTEAFDISCSYNKVMCNLSQAIQIGFRAATMVKANGNTCIALDENRNEVTSTWQRHGIVLAYQDNIGPDPTASRYRRNVCANNIIRNTRWTGIYVNSFSPTQGVGPKVTITGNDISGTGKAPQAGDDQSLQAGISLQQWVSANVTGNTISDTAAVGSPFSVPAIRIHAGTEGGVCNVTGNIIDGVNNGDGIYISRESGDVILTGNTVKNASGQNLVSFTRGNRGGKLQITGNRFMRESGAGQMILLNSENTGGVDTESCDYQVVGNRFEQTGQFVSGNFEVMRIAFPTRLQLVGNKFVGPGSTPQTNSTGLYLASLPTGRNVDDIVIDNNQFEMLARGIGGPVVSGSNGPVIVEGSAFKDVTTRSFNNSLVFGTRSGQDNIIVRSSLLTAVPTFGTWVAGDIVYNPTPAVGQPIYWVCTVSGAPGTWVNGPTL